MDSQCHYSRWTSKKLSYATDFRKLHSLALVYLPSHNSHKCHVSVFLSLSYIISEKMYTFRILKTIKTET
jgi:hypothetical protein